LCSSLILHHLQNFLNLSGSFISFLFLLVK